MHAIHLCLRAVANPGDAVAIESPCFYGLLQALETMGMRAVEVATHPREGIDLGELAALMPDDLTGRRHDGEGFVMAVSSLVSQMPMEQRLSEVGVTQSDLDRLATDAMKVTRLLVNNPREVALEDARAIYAAVL
jgi:alcohol dehydrogenase class IV